MVYDVVFFVGVFVDGVVGGNVVFGVVILSSWV